MLDDLITFRPGQVVKVLTEASARLQPRNIPERRHKLWVALNGVVVNASGMSSTIAIAALDRREGGVHC